MLLKFMKKNSTISSVAFKKYLVSILTFLRFSFSRFVLSSMKKKAYPAFLTSGLKSLLVCLACWLLPSCAKADTPIPTSVTSNYDPVLQRLTMIVNWSWGSDASSKHVGAAVFADLNGDGITPTIFDNPATYTSGGNPFPAGLQARDEFLGQLAISNIEGSASSSMFAGSDNTDNGIASGVSGMTPTSARLLFPYLGNSMAVVNSATGTFTLIYNNVPVSPIKVCVVLYDPHTPFNATSGHSVTSAGPGHNTDNSIEEGNSQGFVPCNSLVLVRCAINKTEGPCQTQTAINTSYAAWLASVTASGCNGVLTNNSTGAPSALGGSKTVTFTYTQSACSNQAPVTTCTATFTVSPCSPCNARVTSLYFNRLSGGADLPITNGSVFTVTQLASLYNLEASALGTVGSVKYTITGPTPSANTENSAPYNSPATGAWTGAVGVYNINLKTYNGPDATGTLCHDTTITFTLTNAPCLVGGINLGDVSNYLFVFTNGSADANWQSASKGYIGNVAVDGIQAAEKTSGSFAYAGTITTNASSLGAWQTIVSNNAGQAFSSLNQTATLTGLENDLNNVFTQVNALAVTSGYNGIAPTALNGLNRQNGLAETIVINVNSAFNVSTKINITGDATDVFILRWDTDMNFANGYQGQVKFQSGGAIVPLGGLKASNFIHVAGDIDASGGGSNPAAPYPQGPRTNNGTGSLIAGGSDFNGGGFFTGYWFTTGDPGNGETSSLSNAIFVGGWYTKTTKFSMTSGTSGVYVAPVCTSATVTLGNRVWYDTDNDGINDASENGIRNVTVNLYKDDNNDNVADGAAITTDITDVNGNYLFTNLGPGNYIVGVVRPGGYVSSNINGGDPDNNVDNDDNGQAVNGTEVRGLAITLASGTEPTGGNTNNTYDFGLLPDCSCTTSPSNLLINASFENGTTGWNWSAGNGSLTTGTGYVACGTKNGFNNQSSGTSKVWQDVNVSAGASVVLTAFAGTHAPGISCSPKLSLIFLNSANAVIGQTDVNVTRVVGDYHDQLEQYSITASAPLGTVKARVQSSITCNTMKLDAFCLRASLGGPLVINMSEFTATKNNCAANLKWQTSSEINSDRFEVEVSINNNAVYIAAGTVIAAGNSSTTKSYQFSYLMHPESTYFFRLKMIDKDGSFKHSDVRSLNCTTVKGIVIAPNPVFTRFTISGMENGKNNVAVYNASGQLMRTQIIAQSQSDVNVINLEPGFYTVKITSEKGITVIKKIIKY